MGHKKQQKLAYHIFTSKFPISHYNVRRSWHSNDEVRNLHTWKKCEKR